MLMSVSTEIKDTRFFEKRYRLAMFLVTSTFKDTQLKTPLLGKWDIEALERGSHPDPFSVLGCQPAQQGEVVFRAFKPGATSVEIEIEGVKYALNPAGNKGLFELVKQGNRTVDYELIANYADGYVHSSRDPYSFGLMVSEFDLHLWGEGKHYKAWKFMGAHKKTVDGVDGTHFVVAAPSASRVSVVGSFNNWDGRVHSMRRYFDQGIWEIFIPGVQEGDIYKFEIASPFVGTPFVKADPFAFASELRPQTASLVAQMPNYKWTDGQWMKNRAAHQSLDAPVSVYEVHLGSWKRSSQDPPYLSYSELADQLIPYVADLGYTHIELLPIAEHPYDPSWGYQTTGYFAPTSRFGKPDDFRHFINMCHQAGIGVLLDWVPAHFAKDAHGLRMFDGTHFYEHADPRQGEHRDWGTMIFNFGRNEVINFLISNANYWCEEFHIDGLRVDAVASMLYADYSRQDGDWLPNKYGGRENLEAIQFLKRFNEVVHEEYPGVVTMAEESTSWPMVSKPTHMGGLGFDFKWNMGWMNDTLDYIQKDTTYRKFYHNKLTFSMMYAFSENFVLPFSHDEVVHLKKAMLTKMPGDDWQRYANLRLIYTYKYAHPGKKLLFMGSEFGQWSEWKAEGNLDWPLLNLAPHRQIYELVKELNHIYKTHTSLYEVDYDWSGFQWIDLHDADHSVISFARYSKERTNYVVCIFNFTPVVHNNYTLGVPETGIYRTILNTDDRRFGGSGVTSASYQSYDGEMHGQPSHITITIPPLAGIYLEFDQII